jgi:hypothetical protein
MVLPGAGLRLARMNTIFLTCSAAGTGVQKIAINGEQVNNHYGEGTRKFGCRLVAANGHGFVEWVRTSWIMNSTTDDIYAIIISIYQEGVFSAGKNCLSPKSDETPKVGDLQYSSCQRRRKSSNFDELAIDWMLWQVRT